MPFLPATSRWTSRFVFFCYKYLTGGLNIKYPFILILFIISVLIGTLYILNTHYQVPRIDPDRIIRSNDQEDRYGPDDIVYGPRVILSPVQTPIIITPKTVYERPIIRRKPRIKKRITRPKPVIKKSVPVLKKENNFIPYKHTDSRFIIPEGVNAKFGRSNGN